MDDAEVPERKGQNVQKMDKKISTVSLQRKLNELCDKVTVMDQRVQRLLQNIYYGSRAHADNEFEQILQQFMNVRLEQDKEKPASPSVVGIARASSTSLGKWNANLNELGNRVKEVLKMVSSSGSPDVFEMLEDRTSTREILEQIKLHAIAIGSRVDQILTAISLSRFDGELVERVESHVEAILREVEDMMEDICNDSDIEETSVYHICSKCHREVLKEGDTKTRVCHKLDVKDKEESSGDVEEIHRICSKCHREIEKTKTKHRTDEGEELTHWICSTCDQKVMVVKDKGKETSTESKETWIHKICSMCHLDMGKTKDKLKTDEEEMLTHWICATCQQKVVVVKPETSSVSDDSEETWTHKICSKCHIGKTETKHKTDEEDRWTHWICSTCHQQVMVKVENKAGEKDRKETSSVSDDSKETWMHKICSMCHIQLKTKTKTFSIKTEKKEDSDWKCSVCHCQLENNKKDKKKDIASDSNDKEKKPSHWKCSKCQREVVEETKTKFWAIGHWDVNKDKKDKDISDSEKVESHQKCSRCQREMEKTKTKFWVIGRKDKTDSTDDKKRQSIRVCSKCHHEIVEKASASMMAIGQRADHILTSVLTDDVSLEERLERVKEDVRFINECVQELLNTIVPEEKTLEEMKKKIRENMKEIDEKVDDLLQTVFPGDDTLEAKAQRIREELEAIDEKIEEILSEIFPAKTSTSVKQLEPARENVKLIGEKVGNILSTLPDENENKLERVRIEVKSVGARIDEILETIIPGEQSIDQRIEMVKDNLEIIGDKVQQIIDTISSSDHWYDFHMDEKFDKMKDNLQKILDSLGHKKKSSSDSKTRENYLEKKDIDKAKLKGVAENVLKEVCDMVPEEEEEQEDDDEEEETATRFKDKLKDFRDKIWKRDDDDDEEGEQPDEEEDEKRLKDKLKDLRDKIWKRDDDEDETEEHKKLRDKIKDFFDDLGHDDDEEDTDEKLRDKVRNFLDDLRSRNKDDEVKDKKRHGIAKKTRPDLKNIEERIEEKAKNKDLKVRRFGELGKAHKDEIAKKFHVDEYNIKRRSSRLAEQKEKFSIDEKVEEILQKVLPSKEKVNLAMQRLREEREAKHYFNVDIRKRPKEDSFGDCLTSLLTDMNHGGALGDVALAITTNIFVDQIESLRNEAVDRARADGRKTIEVGDLEEVIARLFPRPFCDEVMSLAREAVRQEEKEK